ncbi:MAG: ribosome small subunit-dependent GTPase A [Bacteroidetes bacterium]|nr:ribosome small subunit-dependent GTPase A [Bacteroidota bacterium]
MEGLVIKSVGSQYMVRLPDATIIPCRIRGNLRLVGFEATSPVTVGDRVEVEYKTGDDVGMISELMKRKNYIIRKSVKLSKQIQVIAANIDRAYVIATPVFPKTSLGFIDRFLATAEAYTIKAGIIFNKSDLYNAEVKARVAELKSLYENIGYQVMIVSAANPSSLTSLKEELKDQVILFSGHSGVGKSTIINALIPGLSLKTSGISEQHLKGTHTTTFAEMHEIPGGGYIIDTPGIREFGTIDFNKKEVSHFFPEIFKTGRSCQFNNCLHTNEINCAVKDAVRTGEIALSRYESYLSILSNEDIFR